ncbi:MAG: DMT family transporter [Erysipelotrichaceae bacterium]|nr:DMT family transporter [Erysipelotrichaceae bacterium]
MGTLLIILSALGFSLNGVWTVLIREAGDLNVFMLTSLRLLFMGVISLLLLKLTGKNMKMDKGQFHDTLLFALFGNVLTLLLYSAATGYISVGLTCLLNFCYPLIVVAISYFLYQEKIGKYKIIASVLMIIGLLFTSGGGSLNLPGLLLGFGSAASFAVYVLAMEHSRMSEVAGLQVTTIAGFSGCLIVGLLALATGNFTIPTSGKIWLFLLLASLTSNVAPMVCLSEGMKRDVSAARVGFLCILEPACSLIWDRLIFKTILTPLALTGVVIIFASFFVTLKSDDRKEAGQTERNPL